MIEITPENAHDYLVEQGFVPADRAAQIEPLGWGISNVVMRVKVDETCFVFKQSLPKLRVKDDWPLDRRRIFVERDAMAYLGEVLPPGNVPSIRFIDEDNFVLGMSCAPRGGVLWKQALMEGEVDLLASERAGSMLAAIHNRAATDPHVRERFADQGIFVQARVDPYHWTAARAHPDLALVIREEVDRMLSTQLTLVHGDFSPKNIFLYSDHLLLLDFEIAHLGDPAFDTGFCLNHFVLKAIRFPERAPRYLEAARAFWRAYITTLSPSLDPEIEASTIRELGCLLLARIDGKSKIEYITQESMRMTARRLAREILLGTEESLESMLALVFGRLTQREQG
jgi:5-methylthioribose kinase